MNVLDIAIIAVILIPALVGLLSGFVRCLLWLISWAAAVWSAYIYFDAGAHYFEPYIDTPALRSIAAFAAIFILTLLAASCVVYILCRLFALSGVNLVDRLLGMLLGAGLGVLVVSVFLLAGILADITNHIWWEESLLVEHFIPLTDMLRALLPEDLPNDFQPPELIVPDILG